MSARPHDRAGADGILTYFALEAAQLLKLALLRLGKELGVPRFEKLRYGE